MVVPPLDFTLYIKKKKTVSFYNESAFKIVNYQLQLIKKFRYKKLSAEGINIYEGNFNDFINYNWYYINSINSFYNHPVNSQGKLLVERIRNGIKQIFFPDNLDNIYIRSYHTSIGWSNWMQIYPDYSDINLVENGYIIFHNGLILQWDSATIQTQSYKNLEILQSFPISFNNKLLGISAIALTNYDGINNATIVSYGYKSSDNKTTKDTLCIYVRRLSGYSLETGPIGTKYIAIGY